MAEEIVYEEIDESYDTDTLTNLAEQQLELEKQLSELERQADEKKQEINKISKEQLPRAMSFLRMGSFTLETGQGVAIKKHYFGSIKDNEEEAIEYLSKYELDDIVKNLLTVEFARGQESLAKELFDNLMKMGYNVSSNQSIHGSTLKSFIKERVESKEELDEMFRIEIEKPVPSNKESPNWEEYLRFAEEKDMIHDVLFPLDIFKVFIVEEAKITEPKRKKKKGGRK